MIKVIKTDGTETTYETLPVESTLAAIGKWLYAEKADLMELVNILYEGERAQMWVHESGRWKNFPINDKATELYLAHHSPAKRELIKLQGSFIVGDALILTEKDQLA